MTTLTPRQNHKSLYHQLTEGFYDALLVTDPNGHLMEINPRAKEFFQYEQEELWDKPVSTLFPGATAHVFDRIRASLEASRHILLDAPCRRKDGTFFAGEISISSIDLMNKGDMVFCVRNVERRRKQWQVLRSQANAFTCQLSAGFVCDAERVFRMVNPAFLTMFGFDAADDVLGTPFESVFPDAPLRDLFARALTGQTVEEQISFDAGTDAPVLLDVQMMPDVQQKDTVLGVTGSILQIG